MYYMNLLHDKFSHQEKENKISYTNIPKISIYVNIFISFVLFPHNSQFCFPKNTNAGNICRSHVMFYTTQPSQCCKQKFWLVDDFIKDFII